ncbi:RDD family protein [Tsukamurella sp. 8F]|uniref:RDD family protein n=1 Tax=unclassified Tsukamurella TaxID=2633480 RepID=UPI0023B8C392|nr:MULTISPECIES: RDD family protein [unclassified Tsukamurella]MDF0531378.1 RDD family protein [Tsukamurella sp. 8J]MDF0585316.1 RDD family protein [Tsukamurella sp. 8F]
MSVSASTPSETEEPYSADRHSDLSIDGTPAPIVLRVLAYIADLCLVGTAVAVGLIINVLADLQMGWILAGVGALVALVASVALHGAFGASPGKALAQLRVVDEHTARVPGYPMAAARSIVFDILSVVVYLPAWTALADKSGFHRGIHEKVSRTVTVDATEPVSGAEPEDDARTESRLAGFGAPGATAVLPEPGEELDDEGRARLAPPTLSEATGAPRFGPPAGGDAEAVTEATEVRPPDQPTVRQTPGPGPQGPAPSGLVGPGGPGVPPAGPRPTLPQQPPGPRPSAPSQPRPGQQGPLRSVAPRPPQQGQRPAGPAVPRPSAPVTGMPPRTAPGVHAPIQLRFDDGHALDVNGEGLLGREPVVPNGVDGSTINRHVLVDDTASVSKTHMRFGLTRGELWVEDVGSTNGSAISYRDTWTELTPGERYVVERGSVVHIGQRSFKVLAG